jgi:alpha-1,2-mannosyltransferase
MTPRVYEFVAIAIAIVLVGTLAFLVVDGEKLLLRSGQPVFGDFIAFWSAGRAALDGFAAQVHDVALLGRYHQAAVPGVAFIAPWNSPPTFLLIAALFAMLPYPAAAMAFLVVTGAIYLYAARKLLPDTRLLIFAVTLPAALYHLGTVQTGLLVAGLSGLALVWLDRRPLRAGVLIGLLVIKPHLAILWPFLLAFSGRWRVFMAAAVSTLVFILIAGLVFGFDAYLRFFDNLAPSHALISGQRIATPAYASLYGNLLGLGVIPAIAGAVHAISAGAALLAACVVFVRGDRMTAGAALCAATLLISPYLFFYDFTLLAVGAALLGAPRDRTELFAYILAWGAGLSLAVGYLIALPVAPLAAWLLLRVAFRRARSVGVVRAPALQR